MTKNSNWILILIIIIMAVLIYLFGYLKPDNKIINPDISKQALPGFSTDISQTSIDLNSIVIGGPGKDGIPAITNPRFVGLADTEFDDATLGIMVNLNNEVKYYPYNILAWHEIINDSIGDYHFAVTYYLPSSLAIVFDREVEGKILEFSVSGLLFESDSLMYDKQTESLWSPAQQQAIVGEYSGTKLQILPLQQLSLAKIKEKYPQAQVLSTKTGYVRDYSFYPDDNAEDSEELLFPVSVIDERFPAQEIMYVIPWQEKSITFPQANLTNCKTQNLEIADVVLQASRNGDEIEVKIGEETLPGYYERWFSWAIHHQADGVVWEIK